MSFAKRAQKFVLAYNFAKIETDGYVPIWIGRVFAKIRHGKRSKLWIAKPRQFLGGNKIHNVIYLNFKLLKATVLPDRRGDCCRLSAL